MATINLGAIKFNWKGAYNNGTTYAVDDVVSSGGNSYVCIQASQGNAVGNATAYWNIMSSAGTNGTNGTDLTTTLTTQGDIVYRDGSGLARLGYGTNGQVLTTGGSGANPSWGTVSSDMVKVASVNGGDTSALALDSCFSADYENYMIFANIHTSSTTGVNMRLQDASNTEINSASYYYAGVQTYVNSGANGQDHKVGWAQTYFATQESIKPETGGYGAFVITVSRPFLSNRQTNITYTMHCYDNSYIRNTTQGGSYRIDASCAGFRFLVGTGNITANSNVKVYGLKT